MASSAGADASEQGVRFSEHTEERRITPEISLEPIRSLTGAGHGREPLNPEAEEELRQLKTTLQNGLQSKRMEHYNFEPVSLPNSQPVSRVCLVVHLRLRQRRQLYALLVCIRQSMLTWP